MDSLVYALIQVIHNFGAAAVVGFAAYGLWRGGGQSAARRRIFIAIGVAWLVQAASGGAFGLSSLHFYGELPDIHGVALGALVVKIICVVLGLTISTLVLWRGAAADRGKPATLAGQFGLGVTALGAAAFLRWFS